jgi:hypothetical protein
MSISEKKSIFDGDPAQAGQTVTFTPDQLDELIEKIRSNTREEEPPEATEWEMFQKMGGTMPEVLESDYEHKAWLLSSRFVDKKLFQLHDLIVKELSLANLPDSELALIYSFKMDCIEDWLSMGFTELAKQRLVHMLFRLRLSVSVEGREIILQHGSSNVGMNIPSAEGQYSGMGDRDEDGGQRPKFSLRKLFAKAKGMAN